MFYYGWVDYVRYYQREYLRVAVEDHGFAFFILSLTVVSPLFKLIPSRFWTLVPLTIILVYTWLLNPPRRVSMSITDGGKTLKVRSEGPAKQWVNLIVEVLYRLCNLDTDPLMRRIKRLGGYQFLLLNRNVEYRLPHKGFLGALPRRQIILTNHTPGPFRDAFSIFPLIPESSRLIILQHNFNSLVALVCRKAWGAWTIDKDDKTRTGKRRLHSELEKLLTVMKRETDLTVVVFGTGKVPKTVKECRHPERIYPGAVYLSLVSGYMVTPLINDISHPDDVFRAIVREPIDLQSEYRERLTPLPTIGEFRDHPGNKTVIEEACGRLRDMYVEEYDRITKIEHTEWTTG